MPTIDQIKDGKHLYRCLEAYYAMHQTLDRCYIFAFIDSNQKIEKEQRENVVNAIAEVSEYNISKQMLSKIHTDLFLKPSKLPILLSCRKNLILSYRISQDFSEILLNFLNCFCFLWEHHEINYGNFIRKVYMLCIHIFFASNMINYARMTPVYLSQMYALKEKDPQT